MPSWRDRFEQAKQIAQAKAPEARARAEEAAERARAVATEQGEKGRAWLDAKREDRRREAARRERWFEHAGGSTHTQGFPDAEAMRRSIEAAAAQGWTVVTIADVPKRPAWGGLPTLLVREAVEQVKQTSRFMVTFKRAVEGGEASGAASPDRESDQP